MGPPIPLAPQTDLEDVRVPVCDVLDGGKETAGQSSERYHVYCVRGIVPERLPFKPPGVEPPGGEIPLFSRAEAGDRLGCESHGDPGVSRPDTGPLRCRDGADRRLVAQVDRVIFNARPAGSVPSGEVRSYPEAGGSLPIETVDGDPPVAASCCLQIRRGIGRRGAGCVCAAGELVVNCEPRSAGAHRVEPRQVDFSVTAIDMADGFGPEAGRRRVGLCLRRRGTRQQPGADTENGEKAGRCLKRPDPAAPEREAATQDSREREEPLALECRQGESPRKRGAQADPTQ